MRHANGRWPPTLDLEHATVYGRVSATTAALEATQLDVLRPRNGTSLPVTLTEQLNVVGDLQRRADPVGAVQRALVRREST